MFNNLTSLLPDFWISIGQTFIMLGISVGSAVFVGTPLGILFFFTDRGQIFEHKVIHRVIDYVVNTVRSMPFVILLVALIPLTRWVVGTTIGPVAAAVPLSIAAIPYFARLVEQSLREVPKGVIEAAVAMGASPLEIIWKVLLNEARSSLISALTVTTISMLSYSAMAGTVGGIGDLAIRFGYYRFQTEVMVSTVIILILLVQIIQFIGSRIAHVLDKR
ncbi:ABC transporter permease [Collibacillus ludicampi]|uniref:ABC transporter permease n=1 Tax=Collibacillus ludicampi TaxID=2771369 RepID=A0AAV4LBR5_9BACL|nr:methionine ABC transporter permease [Collibacillus ludicampi]GIM45180.1 ABC transporter permease [Collibacillus ludicampi]